MPNGGPIRVRYIGHDLWERNEACSLQEPREPGGYKRSKAHASKDGKERRRKSGGRCFLLGCNNACRIKEGELHLVKMSDTVNRASTTTCSFRAGRGVNDRLKRHISKSSLPPAAFFFHLPPEEEPLINRDQLWTNREINLTESD